MGGRMRERHDEAFGGDRFTILIVVMFSKLCKYVKTYQTVHLKYWQFNKCQLFPNKSYIKNSMDTHQGFTLRMNDRMALLWNVLVIRKGLMVETENSSVRGLV